MDSDRRRDRARRGRVGWLRQAILAAMAGAVLSTAAAAMDFHEVPAAPGCERVCLVAEGEIDVDTAKDFEQVARNLPDGATVALDSLGGRLLLGISVGDVIRKRGFNTVVGRYDAEAGRFGPGSCASACVYAFMGGARRAVAPGSRIGVHQARMGGGSKSLTGRDAQLLMGLAGDSLAKSGADSGLLVLALATPPEEIRWLTPGEMVRLRVVTAAFPSGGDPAATVVAEEARAGRLEVASAIRFRLIGARVPESLTP